MLKRLSFPRKRESSTHRPELCLDHSGLLDCPVKPGNDKTGGLPLIKPVDAEPG